MPTIPALKRFDIYVYKKRSPPTDNALIAVSGAQISLYRQGATIRTAKTILPEQENVAVDVYHTGAVSASDQLRVNNDTQKSLNVVSVDIVTRTLYVSYFGPFNLVLGVGDRLFDQTARPLLYSDPIGTVVVTPSTYPTDADGRRTGYVREYRFDYMISGISGEANRLFIDSEGSFVMR